MRSAAHTTALAHSQGTDESFGLVRWLYEPVVRQLWAGERGVGGGGAEALMENTNEPANDRSN